MRRIVTVRRRLLTALAALGAALVLVELAGRAFLSLRPSYDVVFLQPDRVVGWTQVPGLSWTWAGHHWYAADYSVDIRTNSLGFRDVERSLEKPAETVRVALLGDSFFEAIQVPFEETAGHLLEGMLNERARADGRTERYEVLNFGISNYSVGQYLHVWEEYASGFEPDLVFILVSKLQFDRTTKKYEVGGFRSTRDERLWIRPTFRLEGAELVREPAEDFEECVAKQAELLRTEFGGARSRIRERSLLGHLLRDRLPWSRDEARPPSRRQRHPQISDPGEILAINLRVIEELGRRVDAAGARLVVVDMSGYQGRGAELAEPIERFCADAELGYVSLSERLRQVEGGERATYWRHDPHFNRVGNRVVAEAIRTESHQ